MGKRFRTLNRLDSDFFEAAIRQSVLISSEEVLQVLPNGFLLRKELMYQFKPSCHLSDAVFDACVSLIQEREKTIELAYKQTNRRDRPLRYFIADLSISKARLGGDIDSAASKIKEPTRYSKFIMPFLKDSIFRIVLVDINEKRISCFDPRINSSMPVLASKVPQDFVADLTEWSALITRLLVTLKLCEEDDQSWLRNNVLADSVFPQYVEMVQFFDPLPHHKLYDSGVYALTAIDFISNDVPVIFFLENMNLLRTLLGHQLLVAKFPL